MDPMDMTEGTHAYELRAQSMPNLSRRAMADLFDVVRGEAELARVELGEKARVAAQGGMSLGLAALFLVAALVSLSAAYIGALSTIMAGWAAALVVAVVYLILAFVLASSGRATLARAGGLVPTRSLEHLLGESGSPPNTLAEAEQRVEAAQQNLEKTLAPMSQREATASPMRDVILSGIGVTLAAVQQARNGRR